MSNSLTRNDIYKFMAIFPDVGSITCTPDLQRGQTKPVPKTKNNKLNKLKYSDLTRPINPPFGFRPPVQRSWTINCVVLIKNIKKGPTTWSTLLLFWLRWQDSNLRPSGYEPDELPTAPHRVTFPACGMTKIVLGSFFATQNPPRVHNKR